MSDYPAIFIDQKRYRIRIYKRTLHMLGDPKFIQLLINPEDLLVIVRASDRSDSMTHRIVWENFVSKQSYELTSKQLIQNMQSVCVNWNAGESYRIFGEIVHHENIARFDLRNIVPCSNDWGTQDE